MYFISLYPDLEYIYKNRNEQRRRMHVYLKKIITRFVDSVYLTCKTKKNEKKNVKTVTSKERKKENKRNIF